MTAEDDRPDAQALCCSPVTAGVIDEAAAVELAAVLKALADPVRTNRFLAADDPA